MRRFGFEPFANEEVEGLDLDDIGISGDDLADALLTIQPPDIAPFCDWSRWRRPSDWWATTDAEDHHLDLPRFNHMADRAKFYIREMARPIVESLGVNDDAKVLPYGDGIVSLNDLLDRIDEGEFGQLSVWPDSVEVRQRN